MSDASELTEWLRRNFSFLAAAEFIAAELMSKGRAAEGASGGNSYLMLD